MPLIMDENMSSMQSVKKLKEEGVIMFTMYNGVKFPSNTVKVAILNLMPKKIETEEQLLGILGDIPLNIQVHFLYVKTHRIKNTSMEYLEAHYKCLDEVRDEEYDGMIITGAPVENMEFEEVDYWEELKEILEFSRRKTRSTFHICWAAQAALYHYYGVKKYGVPQKVFGVFKHSINDKKCKLFNGFDDEFFVPHSRHTEIRKEDIEKIPELEILSESSESGLYITAERSGRSFFVTGHSEYSPYTLKYEYERDKDKGLNIEMPKNYFIEDDPHKEPLVRWRAHALLLFSNWVYYYVK